MSNDISETTKKPLVAFCHENSIPCLTAGDKYRLGGAIGKTHRVAVTINEKGIAEAIIKAFAAGDKPNTMGVVEWPK